MLTPGSRIDRFELLAVLGEGGQGSVWRATDLVDGTTRALKLVPLSELGATTLERARREAHLLSKLAHPGLVRCFGLFESFDHGVLGLVLELVEGETLEHAMGDPRLDRQHREVVITQLVGALVYLHERGLVHRDLKPSNVMLSDQFWATPGAPGTVRLVDFGIAVAEHDPKRLTRTGHFIGTVPYLAPEAMDPREFPGSALSPAVDVFALGVLGSVLLSGGHPTGLRMEASVVEFLRVYRQGQLSPFSGDRLGATMRACCEPAAKSRPSSASDVWRMLQGGPGGATVDVGPLGRAPSTEPTPLPVVATEMAHPPSAGPPFAPYPPPQAAPQPPPHGVPRRAQKASLPWMWLIVPAVLSVMLLLAVLGGVSLHAAGYFDALPGRRPTPAPAPQPVAPPTSPPPSPPPISAVRCCGHPANNCARFTPENVSCSQEIKGRYRLRLSHVALDTLPALFGQYPLAEVELRKVKGGGPVVVRGPTMQPCGAPSSLVVEASDMTSGIEIVIRDHGKEVYRAVGRHHFLLGGALCRGFFFSGSALGVVNDTLPVKEVHFFLDPP